MHQDNDQAQDRSEDETVARVLALVGRGATLPDTTKTAWDDTFRGELDGVIARRRRRNQLRWRALGSCAAAILIVVVWSNLGSFPSSNSNSIAEVINGSGAIQIGSSTFEREALHLGTKIDAGSRIQTGPNSLVGLNYRNAQIRLNENTEVQLFADAIQLLKGQVYVSTNGSDYAGLDQASEPHVTVRTALATVTDIGTQFTVSYDHGGLISAVRDGAIKVALETGEYSAIAGHDFAQTVEVNNQKEVAITRSERQGNEWDWTMSLAGEFVIEGRTAYDFLTWATTESGLRLVFTDERTELSARQTILHGDISNFRAQRSDRYCPGDDQFDRTPPGREYP